MKAYKSRHTQEVVNALQWNGSDEALDGLNLPITISEPGTGIVQLNTEDGPVEMHMGYYFIQADRWMGLNPDAFQAEYLPLAE